MNEAAEQLRAEILAALADACRKAATVEVSFAHHPDVATNEAGEQAVAAMQAAAQAGGLPVVPRGATIGTLNIGDGRQALEALRRLAWLVGLSPQERAFLQAAADAARAADPKGRREDFSVFADWLEDHGRERDAARLRELVTLELVTLEQVKLGGCARTDSAAVEALLGLLANMPEGKREGIVFQKAAGAVDRLRRENERLNAEVRRLRSGLRVADQAAEGGR